jgi:hypothetical protein
MTEETATWSQEPGISVPPSSACNHFLGLINGCGDLIPRGGAHLITHLTGADFYDSILINIQALINIACLLLAFVNIVTPCKIQARPQTRTSPLQCLVKIWCSALRHLQQLLRGDVLLRELTFNLPGNYYFSLPEKTSRNEALTRPGQLNSRIVTVMFGVLLEFVQPVCA